MNVVDFLGLPTFKQNLKHELVLFSELKSMCYKTKYILQFLIPKKGCYLCKLNYYIL